MSAVSSTFCTAFNKSAVTVKAVMAEAVRLSHAYCRDNLAFLHNHLVLVMVMLELWQSAEVMKLWKLIKFRKIERKKTPVLSYYILL